MKYATSCALALKSTRKLMAPVLIGIGLLSGQAVQAATPSAMPVAATGSTVADPAIAQRLILARQLLELQGFTAQLTDAFEQLGPILAESLVSNPNLSTLPEADKRKLGEFLIIEIKAAVPQMVDKYAAYFATNLSEPELNELIGIYQRPSMQKFQFLTKASEASLSNELETIGQEAGLRAYENYLKWKKGQ